MLDLRTIAKLLGGEVVSGCQVLAPGPGHAPRDRSLSIKLTGDDFVVYSHAGQDWRECRDHVAGLLGIEPRRCPRTARTAKAGAILPRKIQAASEDDAKDRIKAALQIWSASKPLRTITRNNLPEVQTLGWRYFTERRCLDIGLLDALDHVLCWHDGIGAVVALMTDPKTNEPTGVHRTFLNRDGTKRERKMLGKMGVVRLSPDEDVTVGLGLTEGIEDGLRMLTTGTWSPVWAACSAGAIERFPVLSGIEALTIFCDSDPVGTKAADTAASNWQRAGREARASRFQRTNK